MGIRFSADGSVNRTFAPTLQRLKKGTTDSRDQEKEKLLQRASKYITVRTERPREAPDFLLLEKSKVERPQEVSEPDVFTGPKNHSEDKKERCEEVTENEELPATNNEDQEPLNTQSRRSCSRRRITNLDSSEEEYLQLCIEKDTKLERQCSPQRSKFSVPI